MPQTYAVVYDEHGNFFIARKNERAYFFHSKGGGGTIFPNGIRIKNGPGLSALPGGKLEADDPAIGAADEFFEETGVQLRAFEQELTPPEYHEDPDYFGVYFKVSSEILTLISREAIQNIATAGQAAAGIRNGRIRTYDGIFEIYPNCPQDNELGSGEIWNLFTDWAKIEALRGSRSTDWFYHILLNLRRALTSLPLLENQ